MYAPEKKEDNRDIFDKVLDGFDGSGDASGEQKLAGAVGLIGGILLGNKARKIIKKKLPKGNIPVIELAAGSTGAVAASQYVGPKRNRKKR